MTGPTGPLYFGNTLPTAAYFLSSGQSIPSETVATIIFDTYNALFSNGAISSIYNTGAGTLTNGTSVTLSYLIGAVLYSSSAGAQIVEIRHNGLSTAYRFPFSTTALEGMY
jgi:hypothetical protein